MSKHGNDDGRKESAYLQMNHFFLISLTLKMDIKNLRKNQKIKVYVIAVGQ